MNEQHDPQLPKISISRSYEIPEKVIPAQHHYIDCYVCNNKELHEAAFFIFHTERLRDKQYESMRVCKSCLKEALSQLGD